MDIGRIIEDSVEYTKRALWGRWVDWILLIISVIIFPLIFGYVFRVFRGGNAPPVLKNWVGLFIDGLKLLVVGIIYYIPVWIIGAIFFGGAWGPLVSALEQGRVVELFVALGSIALGLIIILILQIVIYIFLIIGAVRFARTNSFMEGFNFSAILDRISRIGWGQYIIGLIVLWIITIVFPVILGAFMGIPIIGWIIGLALYPAYIIFIARYVSLVYDSG